MKLRARKDFSTPRRYSGRSIGRYVVAVCTMYTVVAYFFSTRDRQSMTDVTTSDDKDTFSIVVLTMDRNEQLSRLLISLEKSQYHDRAVRLEIHIDKSSKNADVVAVSEAFSFSHGEKVMYLSSTQQGLAGSWYSAHKTQSTERFIILEDDVVLSPYWFTWLCDMWENFGSLPELAGITLQRQTLIPKVPSHSREIVNGHFPFLYPLVGSIGFSPNPVVWNEFISWVQQLTPEFDVSTPGLVTSEWWNKLDKKHMWTQHFIYFCVQREYYTLYQNLKNSETLAAHERAGGVHFKNTRGPDFPVATVEPAGLLPDKLQKFDWSGDQVNQERRGFDDITQQTLVFQARRIHRDHGFVYLMFVNAGYVQMTKSWICNILSLDRRILDLVLLVAADTATVRELSAHEPNINYFVYHSEFRQGADFGTYVYYKIVLERLKVQNYLLQSGVNIMIIESDQIWFQDITEGIKRKFDSAFEIIAGDERSHKPQETQSYLCGGFYGIASNSVTVRFFQDYVKSHSEALLQYKDKRGVIAVENDQALLSRLIKEDNLYVHWLGECEYMQGIWYTDKSRQLVCSQIHVLHNNYIVGNRQKQQRAQDWGHWFLSAEERYCSVPLKPTLSWE